MGLGGNVRLTAAIACVTVFIVIYYLKTEELDSAVWYDSHYSHAGSDQNEVPGYLVWSPQCRIPDTNPWHHSIQQYLETTKPVICSNLPLLTFIERRRGAGNVLRIDESVISKYKSYSTHTLQCCYSIISRRSQTLAKYNGQADSKYDVSECKQFKKEAVMSNTTQFVLIKCQSLKPRARAGKEVYKNAHAMIPVLPAVAEKLERQRNASRGSRHDKPSILIIGVDSVSRLNLRRTMPKTLQHVTQNHWVELKGYNKIDDNTFPNLMAILSGENMEQIGRQCYVNKTKKMDDCPNIWKEFRERGYVTAYAEDVPSLGTFNYLQTGFVEQPTDYYMRPFMLATHTILPKKTKDDLYVCVGPTASADHILKYAKDFAITFAEHNYFGLFWTNSLSHNSVNSPGALDFRVARLLNEITLAGADSNTIIFLLSDHGSRFGDIRTTFVGYAEERLPFIFIWLPERFREKYRTKFENLLTNQNRLTSPYDVYLTLKDLQLTEEVVTSRACPKCASLFREASWNRSCEDAGISRHWCMCPEFRHLAPTDPIALQSGRFLYDRIQQRLKDLLVQEKISTPTCANWTFSKVINAHKSVPILDPGADVRETYVIVIQVEPGGAMFEATIEANRTTTLANPSNQGMRMKTLGFISRLDSYSSTTKCVNSRLLKFYCHCLNK